MISRTNASRTQSCNPTLDLIERMKGLVRRRAGKNVAELRIERVSNRIIVRGIARSFYGWQMVQAACREAISREADLALDCAMTVPNDSGSSD